MKFNHTAADEEEYKNHTVFKDLKIMGEFYKSFSFSIIGFATTGTRSVINIDTYIFSSIEGTLESILLILEKGRIGDAYSLLRKFHDSITLNLYTNLFLDENRGKNDNFLVEEVIAWLNNTKKLPHNTYGKMSEYLEGSNRLKAIFDLLNVENSYIETRQRCNDHTHYNFFDNVLINDNKVHAPRRISLLAIFRQDLINLFILHIACVFTLNDHYMMSSDYVDYLDVGLDPEPDSQYWVASFIKEAFSGIVEVNRPDIAKFIKSNTLMHL